VTANTANLTAPCAAKLTIASAGLTAASVQVNLAVFTGQGANQPPAITAVANSASYATGPVAPGTLVTIFGTNLGPRTIASGTFGNGQLTTSLGGLRVMFDGVAAPILYARFDQVGAAVPFEVSDQSQTMVQVSTAAGQTTAPVQLQVSPATPALYTTSSTGTGQGSILNQTGVLNAATAAAAKGSTVAIFMTGAGATTPAGRTGAVAAADQTIASQVTVSIGGQNARVMYAGAVPGSLQGLYQVNAVVPDGVASGSVPVQVTVGGASSQTGVTMYLQ
jgi:uncharacterized protein (TIGR03437 family)